MVMVINHTISTALTTTNGLTTAALGHSLVSRCRHIIRHVVIVVIFGAFLLISRLGALPSRPDGRKGRLPDAAVD